MWQSPASWLLDKSHQEGYHLPGYLLAAIVFLPEAGKKCCPGSAFAPLYCGNVFLLLLLLKILFLQRTETPTTALPLSPFA